MNDLTDIEFESDDDIDIEFLDAPISTEDLEGILAPLEGGEEAHARSWPQLARLVYPFKASLIKKKPGKGGGNYVPHSLVMERVLAILGPHSYEVVREVYDSDGALSGVVGQLTATIDGQRVRVSEYGDVDEIITGEGKNVTGNNGARAKKASSDAYKRCAMRLGCGVQLWSREKSFISMVLQKRLGS